MRRQDDGAETRQQRERLPEHAHDLLRHREHHLDHRHLDHDVRRCFAAEGARDGQGGGKHDDSLSGTRGDPHRVSACEVAV